MKWENKKKIFLEKKLEIVDLVFVWKVGAKKKNHLIVNNTLNVMLIHRSYGFEV